MRKVYDMLVELTYACKMNCTHCMSDCEPDGVNMSRSTLEDALKFMLKHKLDRTFNTVKEAAEAIGSSYRYLFDRMRANLPCHGYTFKDANDDR